MAGSCRVGLPCGSFHSRLVHRLPSPDAMNSFPATTPPHQPHKFTPVTLATRKTVNASEVGHLQRGTAPEWGARRGVHAASRGSHSLRTGGGPGGGGFLLARRGTHFGPRTTPPAPGVHMRHPRHTENSPR